MGRGTGRCIVCGATRADVMLVQIIESGSGPGWGHYACPEPCAQQYAKRTYAPEWLQDDLRARGLWPCSSAT